MENLDVILLTVSVVIAFIIFIATSIKEITRMSDEPYKFEKPSGFTRDALFDVLVSLFEDEEISVKNRKKFKATLDRTISDMETDGVYFNKKKEPLNKENSEEMPDS